MLRRLVSLALLPSLLACGSTAEDPTAPVASVQPAAAASASSGASGAPDASAPECDITAPGCLEGASGFRIVEPSPWGVTLERVRVAEDGSVWMTGDDGLVLRLDRPAGGERKIVKVRVGGWGGVAELARVQDRIASTNAEGSLLPAAGLGGGGAWIATEVGLHLRRGKTWSNVSCGDACGTVWTEDAAGRLWVSGRHGRGASNRPSVIDLRAPTPSFEPGPPLESSDPVRAMATRGTETWALNGGLTQRLYVSVAGGAFVEKPLPKGTMFVDLSFDPAGGTGFLLALEGRSTLLYAIDPAGNISLRAEVPGFQANVLALEGGRVAMVAGRNVFRVEGSTVTQLDPPAASEKEDEDPMGPSPGMEIGFPRIRDLHGLRADDVWFVGAGGVVSHWDGNQLRTLYGSSSEAFLDDLAWASADEWVALHEGTLLRGRLGSTVVTREPTPALKFGPYRDLRGLRSGEILVYALKNILVRRGSGPWARVPEPPHFLSELVGASPTELWAQLESKPISPPTLWFFDGKTWREVTPSAEVIPMKMVAVPGNTLWVLSANARRVQRVRSDGRVDEPLQAGLGRAPEDSFYAIAATSETDVWLAGKQRGQGAVMVHWDGKEVRRYGGLGPYRYDVLAAREGGVAWAAGALKQGAFVEGGKARPIDLGFNVSGLLVHPTGAVVGVGTNGLVVERAARRAR